MISGDFDLLLRHAAMAWLEEHARRGRELVGRDLLMEFRYDGRRIPLMDAQRGIRKPAILESALSFRTTYTPPGSVPPYEDAEGADGLVRYKYRGEDPQHPENIALRTAMERRLPLIWFLGVAQGLYLPRYPVWLVGEDPLRHEFSVAVDGTQRLMPQGDLDSDSRSYVQRLTKERVHQPLFRARVLTAYGRCAICRLRHPNLLDAAHILPDTHPRGTPVVPNGIALCKIHHAAYDQNIVGIRPDLVVEVREDIAREVDGPMLLHGLQEMVGVRLTAPSRRDSRPDRDRLDERYEQFRSAG